MGGALAAQFSGISPPSQTPHLGGVWAELALVGFSFPDVAERFPVVVLVQVLQLLDRTQTPTDRQSLHAHTI